MPQIATPNTVPANASPAPPARLTSVDIYRGMVMFLMLAEVLQLEHLKNRFPESWWAKWISFHTDHVEWRGCSLHDMIQPSFTFLVGTAMALSLTSRAKRGQPWSMMLWHAILRSLILIFLGIFLRSLGKPHTNFTFDDTLTQIGLGYWILFLLSAFSIRGLLLSALVILVGYWGAFVLYPAPGADFPYESVGVPANWSEHYQGIAAHFNKNSNLAWYTDTWWMNLFPRETTFAFSSGGYATLSFIPTLATMVLGLIAGKLLQWPISFSNRFGWLVLGGLLCMASAWGIDSLGLCPIVKRIWTPSWTLWSGGICFLWLAALHAICDAAEFKSWGYPVMVIGSNSIVAYVMSWTMKEPTRAAIYRHFGWMLDGANEMTQQFAVGLSILAIFWLILLWLLRQRIFVRI